MMGKVLRLLGAGFWAGDEWEGERGDDEWEREMMGR